MQEVVTLTASVKRLDRELRSLRESLEAAEAGRAGASFDAADRETILAAPGAIAGRTVQLTTNVNVREGYPNNTEAYFRRVRALGVAQTGERVETLAPPREIDRDSGTRVWANVALTCRPHIGEQRTTQDQS